MTRQVLTEAGLSDWPTECRYCQYSAHKGCCLAMTFWFRCGITLLVWQLLTCCFLSVGFRGQAVRWTQLISSF